MSKIFAKKNDPNNPRQRWLLILRFAINTFLLLSLFLIKKHRVTPALTGDWFELGLIILCLNYILLTSYHFVFPRILKPWAQQIVQITGDILLAISMTMATGGGYSPFSFLFIIAIINSSFYGGLRSALIVASLAAMLWGGLITFQAYGFIVPGLPVLISSNSLTQQIVTILINTGACYLVAFLSGHLAHQIFISRKALAASQANLARLADLNDNIIQSIDSGLLTVDTNGLILSINRPGLNILGLPATEILGRPWQFLLPQLEHILPLSLRSRDSNRICGLRFEFQRQNDEEELTLELDVLALRDKSDVVWGRLFVLKDLTTFLRMEAEIKKTEHLAALGELAAGMAHEIRTPLASMTGSWHMLSEQCLAPEDQDRLMNIIGREMKRLEGLVSDFLSFAKPSKGIPQLVDLNAVIEDQLKILKSSKQEKIKIISHLNDIPPVFFDRDQLIQIIWNLLQNAVEAGDKTENLTITIETQKMPGKSQQTVMSISDNGPGIANENISKIFEPFFTTKAQGTGLGLATVSRLLHEGQGHITVQSNLINGTVFKIFLPNCLIA